MSGSARALQTAAPLVPPSPTLPSLRDAAATCTACELYRSGTQTVFGEGPRDADVMLVGEQPGDREDVEGRPFVGPAGRVLADALVNAGLDRDAVYVTNAVKHFRWEARGKKRIHKTPAMVHVKACRPWLEAEIDVVDPRVLVLLGATAAKSVLGSSFRLTEHRGTFVEVDLAPLVTATAHPSSVLRLEGDERRSATDALVRDLTIAREAAGSSP